MLSESLPPLNPVAFDRAHRRLAERRAANTANLLWGDGLRRRLADVAADAVEKAAGDPVKTLCIAAAAAFDCDDPFDIASAVREALDLPALHGAGELVEAFQRGRPTESLAAEVIAELEDFSDLWASRDAASVFADLPEGGDLAAALQARHHFLRADAALDIAARTVKRLAMPPTQQFIAGPTANLNPFDGNSSEPQAALVELHAKAKRMSVGGVPAADEGADPAAVAMASDPTFDLATDIAGQAAALERAAQEAGAHDYAAALKRLRLGMEPEAAEPEPQPEAIQSDDSLIDLCSPPGLVGEIIDWMHASSDRPNRALLLGAALTFVGTLAGRKFASPSNLRSNNYIVTLAPSGHGKDHAIGRIKALAEAAGLDRYVGPARLMSASALRRLVDREPAVGCYIDEFGGFMSQIHDRRAGLHNSMIRFDLLEMFSAAGTFFAGAEYAGEQATKIHAPNLSVSGTSTPDAFWSSLSSISASDGLLARLILLDVTGPKPARIKARLKPYDIPAELIASLHRLADAHSGGNLARVQGKSPTPFTVPLDAEAEALDEALTAKLDASEEQAAPEALPFLNRLREHALKLALTVAIGCNPEAPVITRPILDWAWRLARLSAATLIRESVDRIADNERSAAFNRILGLVRSAGPKGIQPSKIADKARGIDTRLRVQILDDLKQSGRVRFERSAGTGGRPSERYFIC